MMSFFATVAPILAALSWVGPVLYPFLAVICSVRSL